MSSGATGSIPHTGPKILQPPYRVPWGTKLVRATDIPQPCRLALLPYTTLLHFRPPNRIKRAPDPQREPESVQAHFQVGLCA